MPTYQYACTECGHGFEAVQSFSDDALTECPKCTGRLRKVFNSVGIVFKGSGFYRTDSREKPKDGAGAAKDGATTGSGDQKKADTSAGAAAPAGASSSPSGSGTSGSSSGNSSSATGSKSSSSAGSAA